MRIIILDFGSGTAYVRDVSKGMQGKDADEIANFFMQKLDVKETEAEWMVSPDLLIDYERDTDPGLADDGGKRSKCCNARMVNGGIQCETCGSNGE